MLGCFSRQKRPSSDSTPPPLPIPDSTPSTSVSVSVSASSSSNSVPYKNFNSMFDPSDDSETLNPTSPSPTTTTSDEDVSPKDDDLCSAIASRRFFPACPGRSKSIVDSAAVSVYGIGSGVAVPTYSPDPYGDFRQSMEEMVEALGLDKRAHWARLHELLLCYLALNSKQTHKYIISAFADLLLGITSDTKEEGLLENTTML
ncbi:Transcription repressor OFP12 [Rhynchospora pubera]|uniref:Transcription repressor n=1 Tax=Rhynchospora pubera TaxID=906938 RepID=A0AAV8C4D0_9POAL|nr:Transcription repressor OFP12 [Rhynchospora pubera]